MLRRGRTFPIGSATVATEGEVGEGAVAVDAATEDAEVIAAGAVIADGGEVMAGTEGEADGEGTAAMAMEVIPTEILNKPDTRTHLE